MGNVVAKVELQIEPSFAAVCEMLSAAQEAAQVIPEWHSAERHRLEAATQRLFQIVRQQLRERRVQS